MPNKIPPKHEGLRQAWTAFSFLSGIGIYLVVIVGLCLYIGMQADDFFHVSPVGKVTGIVLGFPIAIYILYRRLKNGQAI